jgi:20S proteasome alpha/beta subunit
MTLVVVFPASDGIVVGSDTQLTRGSTRCQDFKIKVYSSNCLWVGSGEIHVIQRLEKEFKKNRRKKPIEVARDDIGKTINECIENLIELDLRSKYIGEDPVRLLSLHKLETIFAEYTNQAIIYHYFNTGISEIIDRPFALGIGDDFAFAILQKYEDVYKKFDVKKASILVYKILGEAIKVGAYGISLPIDLWIIDSNGARRVESVERNKIIDQSVKLRNGEIKLLIP